MNAPRQQLENDGAHLVARQFASNAANLERLRDQIEAQVRRNNAALVWARLLRIMQRVADYADASGGPVTTGAYVMGEFNGNALTFDASWTLATLTAAARANGLFIKSAAHAASPPNNTAP